MTIRLAKPRNLKFRHTNWWLIIRKEVGVGLGRGRLGMETRGQAEKCLLGIPDNSYHGVSFLWRKRDALWISHVHWFSVSPLSLSVSLSPLGGHQHTLPTGVHLENPQPMRGLWINPSAFSSLGDNSELGSFQLHTISQRVPSKIESQGPVTVIRVLSHSLLALPCLISSLPHRVF